MKKRLMMVGLAMLTMTGTVHGQGFLKKLSNARDKVTEKVDKVTKDVREALTDEEEEQSATTTTTTKKSQTGSTSTTTSSSYEDDGYLIYPSLKRSQLFGITQKSSDGNHRAKAAGQLAEFKTTASTKVTLSTMSMATR